MPDVTCPSCLATALGAIVTAIGGCIAAYAAVVRARHRAAADCEKRLAAARAEAEDLAALLHSERMQ